VFPIFYTIQVKEEEKNPKPTHNSPLQVSFDQAGTQTILATISKGECEYTLEKKLTTYETSLTYLGENEDAFQLNFDQNFAKNATYFNKLLIDRNATEEDIKSLLRTKLRDLLQSEIIIIKYTNFDQILHAYIELMQQGLIEGEGKNIYIVSNRSQAFTNRVLSLFIPDLPQQHVFTVKSSDFLNFLTALSLSQEPEQINTFTTPHNLQNQNTAHYLVLSYLVDQAITHGISLQILGTLLVITLIVLVISTLRQIVGLSVFGVYQPLLFALTLFLIGWKATLFFFFAAILATVIVRVFTHYIRLLQSTKISLLVCTYVLCLLIGFWLDEYLTIGLLGKSLRTNGSIVLPLLIFIMVSDKLFVDTFKITQKSGWIAILEFTIVTFIARGMLNTQLFRTFLLSYPEILLAVLIINVIIGRFSGLQLFELIRFMPLIRKHLEDEEE
jgi:hypothetical protein